jgi:hypothetical protein
MNAFPMFQRKTVTHLPSETVYMCCGANSHPYSRAAWGSSTRPTFMGKWSDESNAAARLNAATTTRFHTLLLRKHGQN